MKLMKRIGEDGRGRNRMVGAGVVRMGMGWNGIFWKDEGYVDRWLGKERLRLMKGWMD